MSANGVFLSAEWRQLAMLNYAVDPALLRPHVPPGTDLDVFDGATYVSMVGFRFLRTRVLGIGIPWHREFDEINLRFYVSRTVDGVARRGVVFIREVVPRPAVALVARALFNENYVTASMRHRIREERDRMPQRIEVEYAWRRAHDQGRIALACEGTAGEAPAGSLERFITEHYWGYALRRGGGCVEYEVAHPPWVIRRADEASFEGETAALYGPQLAAVLRRPPDSALLADGSAITVAFGRRIV